MNHHSRLFRSSQAGPAVRAALALLAVLTLPGLAGPLTVRAAQGQGGKPQGGK